MPSSQPKPPTPPALLTPREAAWALLEEANLIGFRSDGAAGLTPQRNGRQLRYHQRDVAAFIHRMSTACR